MPVTTPRDLEAAARAIEAFLTALGVDIARNPELHATGERVAKAYAEDFLAGYAMDPAAVLADGTASTAPGLVVVSDLAAVTLCPHHLLPASGVVHVGYWPGERVVGLGAIGELVDGFSRRLSLQEDLGQAIVDALVTHLGARGAACVVDLTPSCMTARGDRRHGARALTTAYAGPSGLDPAHQQQFLLALSTRQR